jgi:hypothetical protein
MNLLRTPYSALLLLALFLIGVTSAGAQNQSTALERGYRTGYSDGYTAGFGDSADKSPRDYKNKQDYQQADRSFNEVWGPIEDYRDGYQQGFESGYAAGYDRKDFDSTIPTGFRRRPLPDARNNSGGAIVQDNSSQTGDITPYSAPDPASSAPANSSSGAAGSFSIPRNTLLAVELLTPLSTEVTQHGDRFQARITEPTEFAGAILEGRVTQVKRPGKVKGVAQLQLRFEQIRYPDNTTAEFHADIAEVIPAGSSTEVSVDSEGGLRGRDSTKDDVTKVGAASGIGAIIGGIAGGGHGAAIGAVIGGGAGTAGVMTQRGKDIRLDRGQVLKIKTSTDTGVVASK